MERLMQPDQLRTRILLWAEEEIRLGHLLRNSGGILEAVLYRGELPRGFGPNCVAGDRQTLSSNETKETMAQGQKRGPSPLRRCPRGARQPNRRAGSEQSERSIFFSGGLSFHLWTSSSCLLKSGFGLSTLIAEASSVFLRCTA
jgi:hypothetical protein